MEIRDATPALTLPVNRPCAREGCHRYVQQGNLQEGLGRRVAAIVSAMERDRTIEVFDTRQIVETTIPGQFTGQSIIELELRNRSGVGVIRIRKESEESDDPF